MSKSYWEFIAPYWDTINIYDGPEAFLATYESVPSPFGLLVAAHWCDSEICNGGFKQFFANNTGVLAPEALRGFQAIGQHEVAKVVEDAMRSLGPGYPRDREQRRQRLRGDVLTRLDELNRSYFALNNADAGGFEVAADTYANASGT